MNNYFGQKIRDVRESKNMLLRQLAAFLEVDTALISKIEKGDRKANKIQISKISSALELNEKELLTLWLADRIEKAISDNKENALDALNLIKENYND
ncbi:helix-turn-helix transcriptional regulator [Rasiella rasia]|jgi:HTH-type transcriptional regulator, competence development regulator|uniref:Helix-turn-helix transcriptional regulator n=1 Tax=Rasiella rasia TaxID=2744027 RepID=A0A6G6GJE3_9FLAO|nr:helix-turn-helix transcriptional regulator [Rasiella rasia]QIE58672.1 helix-turn-helix transcriptional regulator [Rasiella rasia]